MAESGKTEVRTTIRPLDVIEVDGAELADLKALGILLDSTATTDAGLQSAAERQTTEKEEG